MFTDPDQRTSWMVVDRRRRAILTNLTDRDDAQARADELKAYGDTASYPYRVVRDVVAESLDADADADADADDEDEHPAHRDGQEDR